MFLFDIKEQMPVNEKNFGHIRLRPPIWKEYKEMSAKTRRTLTEEVHLALEEHIKRCKRKKGT